MILCEEQNHKSQVGTVSYMPATFGIACASVVVRELTTQTENGSDDKLRAECACTLCRGAKEQKPAEQD